MRYRYSIPGEVKGLVEWKLAHYREMQKEIERYKLDMIPSATPSYSLTGGGSTGGESRPNENIVLKMVTDRYIVETTRTVEAITFVLSHLPEEDLQLVDLVYWRQTYTVEGASTVLNCSKSTAYRRINNVLTAIAVELGLVPFENK